MIKKSSESGFPNFERVSFFAYKLLVKGGVESITKAFQEGKPCQRTSNINIVLLPYNIVLQSSGK